MTPAAGGERVAGRACGLHRDTHAVVTVLNDHADPLLGVRGAGSFVVNHPEPGPWAAVGGGRIEETALERAGCMARDGTGPGDGLFLMRVVGIDPINREDEAL